jgi:hypothetical protein
MTVTEQALADERDRVAEVVQRLRERYPTLPADRVEGAVRQAHRELDSARVRDFVPVLVEKRARDLLRQIPTQA